MARQAISKRMRFDILMRDKFTCRYCGRRPPHVMIEIDHVTPVASGGDNDNDNLVAACHECNAGKSARDDVLHPAADIGLIALERYMHMEDRFRSIMDSAESLDPLPVVIACERLGELTDAQIVECARHPAVTDVLTDDLVEYEQVWVVEVAMRLASYALGYVVPPSEAGLD